MYVAASLITFAAYAIDKKAAERDARRSGARRNGARRVPESTLHLLSLLGGWSGAWIAQRVLRHKTVKQPFQSLFLASVILNMLGFFLYCSPDALAALLKFLGWT